MIDAPRNHLTLDSTRRGSPVQQVAPKRYNAPADIILNPIPTVKARPITANHGGEQLNPVEANPVSTSTDHDEIPENELPTLNLSL